MEQDQGDIWELSGKLWQETGKHLGDIWEPTGSIREATVKYLRAIWTDLAAQKGQDKADRWGKYIPWINDIF
jgi:hypothetical protein